MKNEKGIITIWLVVTLILMVTVLMSTYLVLVNKYKRQEETTEQIKQVYEGKNPEEVYNSFFGNKNEYVELEYIESTGTQYIDTGIIPNQNTGFEIKFYTNNIIGSSNYGSIFGGRTGANNSELQLTTYSNNINGGTLSYSNTEYNPKIINQTEQTCSLRNKIFTDCDGIQTTLNASDFTSSSSITVFALNDNNTITQNGSVKIYYIKFYDGDTLIRDMVPVYRSRDEEIGLFDRVNNVFYSNQGNDEFIYPNLENTNNNEDIIPIYTVEQLLKIGSGECIKMNEKYYYLNASSFYILMNDLEFDVDDWENILGVDTDWLSIGDTDYNFDGNGHSIITTFLNDITKELNKSNNYARGYIELEYIESTGTQYINTGIIPNQDTGFEIKFYTNKIISSSNYECVFGGGTGPNDSELQLTTYSNNNNSGTLKYSNMEYNSKMISQTEQICSLRNKIFTDCDGIQTTLNAGDFTSSSSITIFALNSNNTITQNGQVRVYYIKFYDGDTLIRDMIPVYRARDEKTGLFDKVNNVFYSNQGNDEFIYSNLENANNNEDVIPIYTVEHLLKIGSGERIKLNNNYYYLNTTSFYILMNDLEFDVDDWENILGVDTDWLSIGDTDYNFDGNDHTIITTFLNDTTKELNKSNNYARGYIELEYIESTGTQYIDTGIIPNQNSGFEIKFYTNNIISSSNYGSIFGGRTGSKNSELQLTTYTNDTKKGTLRYSNADYNPKIIKGTEQTCSLRNKIFTDCDGIQTTLNAGDFTSSSSITIFALNSNNTITQNGQVRIYYIKFYDGDTLIRDMVPLYSPRDGKIGLFDKVNSVFYENEGTGDFLYSE